MQTEDMAIMEEAQTTMEKMQAEALVSSLQGLDLEKKDEESATESEHQPQPCLEEVEEIIGYEFINKGLLKEAFTHHSYKADDCQSYERLEYFGDSVLNLMIAQEHYFGYPDMAPGELTRLRAANVDTEALARVALKHNLQKFLRHRKPKLDGQIKGFVAGIEEYPWHSHGMIDPPKVLADIVESLVGAIFIDTGRSIDATWEVVKKLLRPLITPENLNLHPVAKFHETCQKIGIKPQAKDLWEKTGEIEIYIDNEFIGRGQYKLKKIIAVNRAAADAYNNLVKKLGLKNGLIGC